MKYAIFVSSYKIEELHIFQKNEKFFNKVADIAELFIMVNPTIFEKASKMTFGNIKTTITPGIPDMMSPYDEGSYRHAGNLNLLAELYGNDFYAFLFCDPDIVFTNERLLDMLLSNHSRGADIIGSNWDKTIPSKWQDFPAPHFISLKNSVLHHSTVDFRPNLEKSFKKRQIGKKYKSLIVANKFPILKKLNGFLTFGLLLLKKNLSTDTGYYLRGVVHRHKLKVKFIENEVNYYNLVDLERIKKGLNRFIRNWAPYYFGFIPKRETYRSALIENHFKVYKETRPEELFLDNELVALHFRSVRVINQQKQNGLDTNIAFVKSESNFLNISYKTYRRSPKFQVIKED